MTPAERQMISDLFTRIGRLGPIEKDREAACGRATEVR